MLLHFLFFSLSFSTQTLNREDEPPHGILRTGNGGSRVVLAPLSDVKGALGLQTNKSPLGTAFVGFLGDLHLIGQPGQRKALCF